MDILDLLEDLEELVLEVETDIVVISDLSDPVEQVEQVDILKVVEDLVELVLDLTEVDPAVLILHLATDIKFKFKLIFLTNLYK